MKVIIFGATGSVGRITVQTLLDQGHEVTAFARNPEKLPQDQDGLHLHAGDALQFEDVSRAIRGQDAVVVALGAGASRKSRIRSQGTMNIIRAMQDHGVRRLICQSTLGAHESWGNLNFFWKRIMFGLLLRPVFKDHELQEQIVRASGLDWTLVRPSAFTDAPVGGPFREGFASQERKLRLKIPRADVAGFLARQLQDTRYLRAAVGISY
ncbi:NAD(P)-binding oxidoreductase [Shimia sp. SDUM112013]|uniref:NAD(P)-dependent oxidoreductase n=1 Tax=Shimia sp. SDUM112013 TaxID=3136160 RepID=UPI0032EBB855